MAKKMDLNRIMQYRKKGMTYKEIAKEMDTTEQVIKNTVYRAKQTNTSSHKREGLVKSDKRIEALTAQYEKHMVAKSVMKEADGGRASAVNTHIAQCMAIGKMADPDNINSMYAAFEAYIKLCAESDCPMTLLSACLAIGIHKQTLYSWSAGKQRTDNPDYKEFAKSVYFAVQAGIETCMASGLINPVVGIWWEKAHFREIEADKRAAEDVAQSDQRKTAKQIADEYDGLELPD